jgi:hypothetical protein
MGKRTKRNQQLKILAETPPPSPQVPPAEPEPEPEPEPVPTQTCVYIIGRGKRKGQECGKKCKEGPYCSTHSDKEKAIEY